MKCNKCNILALLSIVFVPNANHDVSTGQVSDIHFLFSRVFIRIFSYGFVISKIATNGRSSKLYYVRIHDLSISYLIILVEFL